ncbi:RNA-directed DNA polymerase [Xanthomonas sp. 10-10]|uniref:RNA-directed DNA polymerase n=1 Tax=Xanthomonas sp. 10-10 TaxID=3115848 RepID=A0AAU7PAB2_9XANT
MKSFEGWAAVSIHDLLIAYRKAKADCFFEHTFPAASKFAKYEESLLDNLQSLLNKLQANGDISSIPGILGRYRLVPKKLQVIKKKTPSASGHVHFSDVRRNFENIKRTHDVVPDFRIIGDLPVDAHVLSALWINFIGHKLDAALESSCYGARLRRIRPDVEDADDFHIRAIGSFPPYFQAYQRWRSDGLNAIRYELERDKKVVAVSLDLKSYYHTVDPGAIALPALIEELGVSLNEFEAEFNAGFGRYLSAWSEGARKFGLEISPSAAEIRGGLVIGLTASRVISNVFLAKWDRLIKEKLAPIHYGRYVDDMFLVIRDTGLINSDLELMEYLAKAVGQDVLKAIGDGGFWEIDLGQDILGSSRISLQANKQKLFILQGGAGLDLLDSIESEINSLSSEHRLMPSPDEIESSPAARVLSAAGVVGDSADTLRRADGLTIRRLSWALQLRHVETLARDLPLGQWTDQRKQFYEFAHNHILRPDTLFAHISYIPRLLGFAISMDEWSAARVIAEKSYGAIDDLAVAVPEGARAILNGVEIASSTAVWAAVRNSLTLQFADSLVRFISPEDLLINKMPKESSLLELIALELATYGNPSGEDGLAIGSGFRDLAISVALADLAKVPFKRMLLNRSTSRLIRSVKEGSEAAVIMQIAQSSIFKVDVVQEFLTLTRKSRLRPASYAEGEVESLFSYIFPTRPFTPTEISELAPACVDPNLANMENGTPAKIWAKYTSALRGVWVRPTLIANENESPDVDSRKKRGSRFFRIGTFSKEKVVVALPSIETADSDWAAMACGKGNLSSSRYGAISEIVNKAIKLAVRPDYLIFPELSLPIEWVDSVASRLGSAGISLVAGTEYRHISRSVVHSEACLVLTDNRLGFPSFSKIWQPKLEPAVNEDKDLQAVHGKQWKIFGDTYKKIQSKKRTVYIHNGVHLGIMVCSELQNSRSRVSFQGSVDALFVLCWNPDLDTFASLVESAALDIHAYTVLVNNRKYGDSRIRVPAKKSFDRDLARVRGGDNDFLVAATLDVASLRHFQSRAKRWPSPQDKYKPVPEGFKLIKTRRKLPAS